jgi:3-methyladenine DNA glycosylase/8-oxoguanine DNA glycosylase
VSALSRTLTVPALLSFTQTLGTLVRGASDPTFRVTRDEIVRATRTALGPATLHIVRTEDDTAVARAWGDGAARALEGVQALLGLDDDPPDARTFDEPVRTFAKRATGMRLPKVDNVFEVLVPVVLEQLVTGVESKRAHRALVARFSSEAPGPFDKLMLPPSPDIVRRIDPDVWLPMGVLRKQGETLRRIAERAGRLEETRTMTLDDAYTRLTGISGIGPWTAGNVLLHALGHADAVVVADFHLPNMVAWNLAGEERADDARMLELLAPYTGQRGRVLRFIMGSGSNAPRHGPRRPVRRSW